MSLSARTPTTLDTNKFIPEIFSARIVSTAKPAFVALDAVDSSWEKDLKKGDTLYITKSNVVTATEVVVGTKGTALNPFNTTAVTLTVNQYYEAPYDYDYMSRHQSVANVEAEAVVQCSQAIKKVIDTSICTLFSSLGSYSTSAYGSDGQTFTDDIAIYLKETLDEADVPADDGQRSWVVDPSVQADMLKIDKLLSADFTSKGAVANGIIGRSVYGGVVRVTNNLVAASTGNYAALLHKKAIAAAVQIMRSWVKNFEELHQIRYQAEALWGVIEVMDDWGIPFYTRKA